MHRLSLTVIDATAAMPFALRLGGSPAVRLAAARRAGPRPLAWLRFGSGAGARRLCSAEAARRGGGGEDAEAEAEGRRGGGSRVPSERRMRGGGNAAAAAVGTSIELLAIPGVGPRNLRKLVDNGFEGVAQLKQLYRDKVHLACVSPFADLCVTSRISLASGRGYYTTPLLDWLYYALKKSLVHVPTVVLRFR